MADRAPSSPDSLKRIGWVGLSDNLRYLGAIGRALQRLAKRDDWVLTVISDEDFELRGCRVENWRWSLATQEQSISRLDVGIMPLPDNSPWARGKCAYKLLQYMAAGVSVVGSRVGMNLQVIEQGSTGLLATRTSDWVAALSRLLDDEKQRAVIGERARTRVCAHYSYPVIADALSRFFQRLPSPAPEHSSRWQETSTTS